MSRRSVNDLFEPIQAWVEDGQWLLDEGIKLLESETILTVDEWVKLMRATKSLHENSGRSTETGRVLMAVLERGAMDLAKTYPVLGNETQLHDSNTWVASIEKHVEEYFRHQPQKTQDLGKTIILWAQGLTDGPYPWMRKDYIEHGVRILLGLIPKGIASDALTKHFEQNSIE